MLTVRYDRVPKKAGLMRAEGMIRNLNTMKDLKEYEYNNLIKQAGKQVSSLLLQSACTAY